MDKLAETRLNIYEACYNGYISESEKSKLLTLTNAVYMIESDSEDEDNDKKKKEIKKYVKTLTKIIGIVGILIVAYKAAEKYSNEKYGFDATIKELEKFSNECYRSIDDVLNGTATIDDIGKKRLDYVHKARELNNKCISNPLIKLTPDQKEKLRYMHSEILCGGQKH